MTSEARTKATTVAVGDFIAMLDNRRGAEARELDVLFRRVTGYVPRMWGPSIIGYGRYAYRYESGRSGEMCAAGFSPRGKAISVYVLPGYQDFGAILARLGKHRIGKACLYLNRLSDADQDVLAELIAAGLVGLRARWPVTAE